MPSRTNVGDLLELGVDVYKRRIYFGDCIASAEEDIGAVHQRSVELAVRGLHLLVTESTGKPIELHMSSYGGDAYSMLRFYDEILACPCQVKFFGSGAIMSAATWIMAACDERYLHPNTTVMLHDGSEELAGNHTDVRIGAAESRRLQDRLYELYASNSRMPVAFWEDICQRDVYLTAEETVALGLADKVLEPKKRGNLRKMRQASLRKQPDKADMQKLVKNIYSRVNKHNIPKIELNKPVKELDDPNIRVDLDVVPEIVSEVAVPVVANQVKMAEPA